MSVEKWAEMICRGYVLEEYGGLLVGVNPDRRFWFKKRGVNPHRRIIIIRVGPADISHRVGEWYNWSA